ncbi:glycosyltransferase family 2 protein [Rubrolithibacter danxiaensis]|uniref:glycosyltransferase family 2 protein n=1 Tax=Rubrolithibacter danxiaensis TaxID=3390805 RepID=UPI003BF8021A
MIKISIITVTYNNSSGLKKTIDSVLNQTYHLIEFIIIDGGSTDDSVQVIRSVEDKLTYWASEADNGIYHAMNKGWKIATGDYCFFLNSGDTLYNNKSIDEVTNGILKCPNFAIYYCNLQLFYPLIATFKLKTYPEHIHLNFFSTSTICHQAVFISRFCLLELNGYLENYTIISDWIFFITAWLQGFT